MDQTITVSSITSYRESIVREPAFGAVFEAIWSRFSRNLPAGSGPGASAASRSEPIAPCIARVPGSARATVACVGRGRPAYARLCPGAGGGHPPHLGRCTRRADALAQAAGSESSPRFAAGAAFGAPSLTIGRYNVYLGAVAGQAQFRGRAGRGTRLAVGRPGPDTPSRSR